MRCPNCNATLRQVRVVIAGAKQRATSYQCPKCDYFSFDAKSAQRVVVELSKTPLRMQQKIIKLSAGRLGMYFNKDIIRSLGMKAGEGIAISVPDEKHIVIEME